MDKTLSAATKTKQFKTLINAGLKLVSTDRQLANGSIALTGKFGKGRKAIKPTYVVTSTGAVLSNEFVARRVQGDSAIDTYRQGFEAVQELLSKRIS